MSPIIEPIARLARSEEEGRQLCLGDQLHVLSCRPQNFSVHDQLDNALVHHSGWLTDLKWQSLYHKPLPSRPVSWSSLHKALIPSIGHDAESAFKI